MRVGVIGINHKLADLKLREDLAKACHRRFSMGQRLQNNQACVLLSTCNRTEVYFCSEDLPQVHSYLLSVLRHEINEDFDQRLYSYFGHDCFQHLCRVTAGLDSAIVAETEIQGQVKMAYETAAEYADLPSELHYLFQKALKIGKKVRSDLPWRAGLPDLEHSIFNAGFTCFSNLKQSKVLCVGASDINKKIISFLKNKRLSNITLCNRSLGHAQEIAKDYGIALLDWNHINEWHHYDWIIFGTKSPDYIITKKHIPSHISMKLIVDLSVPRNVDPQINQDSRITLLNIDQLNHTLKDRFQEMNQSICQAEKMVAEDTKYQVKLFKQKQNNRIDFVFASA
jgi:glutamyl-tRNA reductase